MGSRDAIARLRVRIRLVNCVADVIAAVSFSGRCKRLLGNPARLATDVHLRHAIGQCIEHPTERVVLKLRLDEWELAFGNAILDRKHARIGLYARHEDTQSMAREPLTFRAPAHGSHERGS